jgi:hypothetical protein
MSGPFPILAALVVAAVTIWWTVTAWTWKADDGNHRLARWYHHSYRIQRRAARMGAAVIPIASGWAILFGISATVTELAPRVAESLSWLAMLAGAPLLVLSLWAAIRPARWMLPPWLGEAERRETAGLTSNVPLPPEGDRPVMSRRALALNAIGLGALAVVCWYLDVPMYYLLIGIGFALPILAATRLKK